MTVAGFLLFLPVALLRQQRRNAAQRGAPALHRRAEPTVFLFRGAEVADASAPARRLAEREGMASRKAVLDWLSQRVPDLPAAVDRLERDGVVSLQSPGGRGGPRLRADLEALGEGFVRLTVEDPDATDSGVVIDALSAAAMEGELAALRDVADLSETPAWREASDGTVTWANAAYVELCEVVQPGSGLWPLPRLIDVPHADPGAAPHRRELRVGERSRWFDCRCHDVEGGEMLVFAFAADGVVAAERNLRDFVQTLTKTFADLPIGLAIFDRDRKLQLFNPALIDLTRLPTGFLSARPSLFALLDRLRETRMVPEPRDYRSWRRQMNTLEAGAAAGHHVETWSLPGGQTYRVTGRPHADGGVAFLFEDITSEIALTRGFRADLAVHVQLLDALDEAVAVVDRDGLPLVRNETWLALCGDRDEPLRAVIGRWRALAEGQGTGSDRLLAALDARATDRTAGRGAMLGPDGPLTWVVAPLPGGRALVRLSALPDRQGTTEGGSASPAADDLQLPLAVGLL